MTPVEKEQINAVISSLEAFRDPIIDKWIVILANLTRDRKPVDKKTPKAFRGLKGTRTSQGVIR